MKQILRLSLLFLLVNSCGTSKPAEKQEGIINEKTSVDAPSKSSDFIIAFGSCNRQDLPQPLWESIVENNPDLFIWGGDNVYADTADMQQLENDYETQKANAGYQKLLASTEILATWDDHDYGQNNGGTNWEFKKESQQKFLDFLDVPVNDLRREREGVYHSKLYTTPKGSVKVIVLDTRYFRSDLTMSETPGKRYEPDPEGTILGEAQWTWLEQELKDSRADFNILVSSIQILAAEHGFETWGNFPLEVVKLEDLIASSGAQNVVILTGDRHISEFSRKQVKGLKYALVDFTSSGLTHTYTGFTGEPNQYRTGEVVSDLSFGLLFIDFDSRSIRMEMRGKENILQQEHLEKYK
ncbi:alkaline phosphatase family protein [Antarcticibacterium arcticum]|uniref:Alkaline phosphatase family protein n=1 Tax=Antarcticibacterium arcticum TaxID=2585771 RepID=A0A5B8YIF8_9FLAO|nr:alkaline phosphatase D family protein [Antarcticibacterium arcticum]QED37411.1 alkaline phosphatase family protein [Antarcticibacterium arcticum]